MEAQCTQYVRRRMYTVTDFKIGSTANLFIENNIDITKFEGNI